MAEETARTRAAFFAMLRADKSRFAKIAAEHVNEYTGWLMGTDKKERRHYWWKCQGCGSTFPRTRPALPRRCSACGRRRAQFTLIGRSL